MNTPPSCSPIAAITGVKKPQRQACEACVKSWENWVQLRTCQTCGATLCGDNSPNRHTSRHAPESGHPVIASVEPGERGPCCYPDDLLAEY